jgi:dolichol kinase
MILLKETLRKGIHISSLLIPLFYRYVLGFDQRRLMFYLLLAAFVVMLVVEFQRFWQRSFRRTFWWIFGMVLRRHEMKDFTGATYLLFSEMLCVAFFEPNIAFCAMAFLSLGDTFAAIFGINFGKRLHPGQKKSLEGSLACFIGCFVFGLFFFPNNPLIALTGSLGATLAEQSKIPVDDNVDMPIVSAIVMTLTKVLFWTGRA